MFLHQLIGVSLYCIVAIAMYTLRNPEFHEQIIITVAIYVYNKRNGKKEQLEITFYFDTVVIGGFSSKMIFNFFCYTNLK